MNLWTVIQSGIKEIGAHWFRSALTMFGVVCGVASLVTMAAFVKGKENLLRESLAQTGGMEKINLESEDDLPDYQKHLEPEARGVTLKDVYALREGAPMVHTVTPIINKRYTRVSRQAKGTRIPLLIGTWPGAVELLEHQIDHGRMFSMMEDYVANNVCVIGTEVRNQLFGEYDDDGQPIVPLGEKILINYVPFTIVGMFREYMSDEDRKKKEEAIARGETIPTARNPFYRMRGGDRNAARSQYIYYQKNSTVMVPLNTLVSKLDSSYETGSMLDRKLSEVTMKIHDVSLMSPSLQQVRNVVMRTHNGLEDFDFETQEEFADDINLAIHNERVSGMFIAGLCLLVGGIGIVNIMLSSISERVREIGIRKSIGATNSDIFTQIITESMVLAMAGGILGLIISPILVNTLASFAEDTTPPVITSVAMAVAFAFSVLTGTLAGLFPAVKAAKLDPIQALRYD